MIPCALTTYQMTSRISWLNIPSPLLVCSMNRLDHVLRSKLAVYNITSLKTFFSLITGLSLLMNLWKTICLSNYRSKCPICAGLFISTNLRVSPTPNAIVAYPHRNLSKTLSSDSSTRLLYVWRTKKLEAID